MPSPNKTDIWMPLYIGDFLADTGHLSTEGIGAYMMLLMHYWRTGPLPNDDLKLANITRLAPDPWRVHQGVLKEFFTVGEDGRLHQKRIDQVLSQSAEKKQKAVDKSNKMNEIRWGDKKKDKPSGVPPSNPIRILQGVHTGIVDVSSLSLPLEVKKSPIVPLDEEAIDCTVLGRCIGEKCGLFTIKPQAAIAAVCRVELVAGKKPEEIEATLIASWKAFQPLKMEFKLGAERFFGEGEWKKYVKAPAEEREWNSDLKSQEAFRADLREKDRIAWEAKAPEERLKIELLNKLGSEPVRIKIELQKRYPKWSAMQINQERDRLVEIKLKELEAQEEANGQA